MQTIVQTGKRRMVRILQKAPRGKQARALLEAPREEGVLCRFMRNARMNILVLLEGGPMFVRRVDGGVQAIAAVNRFLITTHVREHGRFASIASVFRAHTLGAPLLMAGRRLKNAGPPVVWLDMPTEETCLKYCNVLGRRVPYAKFSMLRGAVLPDGSSQGGNLLRDSGFLVVSRKGNALKDAALELKEVIRARTDGVDTVIFLPNRAPNRAGAVKKGSANAVSEGVVILVGSGAEKSALCLRKLVGAKTTTVWRL